MNTISRQEFLQRTAMAGAGLYFLLWKDLHCQQQIKK